MSTEERVDDLSQGTNRDVSMETPPSSPPHPSRRLDSSNSNDGPPSLTDIVSLSLSPITSGRESPQAESPKTDADLGAKLSTPTQLQLFSTPDRSGSCGNLQLAAPGGSDPVLPVGHHGAPVSDLTPVISNNSGLYVDARPTSGTTRPGFPGLPPGVGLPEARPPAPRGVDDPPPTGLRQRRHPRAGVPPMPMPSSRASSDPAGRSWPKASPPTPLSATSGTTSLSEDASDEGIARLLGERLSMPNYSDDGSSVDTSGGGGRAGADLRTAPVELRPDQRFYSFQGAAQYRRRVGADAAGPSTGPGAVPSRPPTSPKKGKGGREVQYQPLLRSQHGVKEMADADDLKAIFKAPRKKPSAAGTVVTPLASPMQLDGQLLQPSQEKGAADGADVLARPYPVESQWSIPSIRLANRLDQTSSSGDHHPMDSFASYADYSECTDDDESFYSFLEDDDASLSSRGSADAGARRRRRISGIFQLQRKASEGSAAVPPPQPSIVSPAAGASSDLPSEGAAAGASVEDPALATSRSTNDDVAVADPPALSRRARTFDSEGPPPVLDVDAAVDDLARPRRHRRRRRGGRRRRREGDDDATEWLRELQDRSQRGSASASGGAGRGEFLIAEAASSKFLGADDADGGGAGSGEATKALGMPHPLCRSSTIEPGPFVHRTFGAGGVDVGGAGLGSGNSIALTSSGSGD